MMGSGKSTVGRLVADRLGRPFIDSDQQVEAQTGRTVAEIFRTDGEAAFRRIEADVLADAVASPEASVIAAAGGTVLDAANRVLLRSAGTVVWLRLSPETAIERLRRSGDTHRPLLDDDPDTVLRQMAAHREPLYQEVADLTLDVDDVTPADLAGAILDATGVAA
jgi:shikimate kinase